MGGRRGNGDHALSYGESGRCVTLVIMKGLLWRISHRDRVPPSGGSAGRTNGVSVNPSQGILSFPSVAWSLSFDDLESFCLVVVLLLEGTGV